MMLAALEVDDSEQRTVVEVNCVLNPPCRPQMELTDIVELSG